MQPELVGKDLSCHRRPVGWVRSSVMSLASSPFGSNTRTSILVQLSLRGHAHVRLLSRLLGAPLSVVQHALQTLEADGLVACRREGRVRQVYLSPAYPAHDELVRYLRRLAETHPDGKGSRMARV